MSVSGTVKLDINLAEILDSGENRSNGIDHKLSLDLRFKTGTGSGQVDRIWSDRRTLASSGTDTLDLAGVLTDSYGSTITFSKIKLVYIKNRSSTDGVDLRAGPDATNGWVGMFIDASDRNRIAAGGCLLWYDPNGQSVGAGATDELWVQNDGSVSCDYDIIVVGTSA